MQYSHKLTNKAQTPLNLLLNWGEPLILLFVGVVYWFPSPIRDVWLWVLVLWLPILLVRRILTGRLWTETLFDVWMLGLLGLCLLNIYLSPFETRGAMLIFRPLFGIILIIYCVEYVRTRQHTRGLLHGLVILSGAVGMGALLATNWAEKGTNALAITAALPHWRGFHLWIGGFNANEIAGGITWLVPIMLHLGIRHRNLFAMGAAFLMLTAVVLGGSLSGTVGIVIGIALTLTPRRLFAPAVMILIAGIVFAQTLIMFAPAQTVEALKALIPRTDTTSLDHRLQLWQSGLNILADHPFTGIGMMNYRMPLVRYTYPTPDFDPLAAVHAHNEIIHIGTDLGIGGIVFWIGVHAVAILQLLRLRRGQPLAAALIAALVGHLVYGLADTISLFDRFAFVWWWLIGITAALYWLERRVDSSK